MIDLLRFSKLFAALGVDYRVVSDETVDWWESESRQGRMNG
jgi:hypothetical protein